MMSIREFREKSWVATWLEWFTGDLHILLLDLIIDASIHVSCSWEMIRNVLGKREDQKMH
jgi:hypothetical protein